MSQGLARDGLELVIEGERNFIASLKRVDGAWQATIKGLDQASTVTLRASAGMSQAEQSSKGLGAGLVAAAGAAGVAFAAINTLVSTVGKLTNAFAQALSKSLLLAGEFQEMEFTALAIGRAMGLTEEEIRGAAKAIEEEGVRADVANRVVAQFARNQLDLAKATDLVRIAQATGIIIGEDSSATMQSLTRAITTGSTVMLRRMGIMLDNQQIEEQLARDLGVTTSQLSQQQKMMARTNAIIEQGANLLKVYDAAMESPTKQLRSLTGRVLPQLQAALGAPFLQAWSTVIGSVTSFTKALTAAVQEGGALYPVLVQLGAWASIMADGFASAVDKITNLITNMGDEVNLGIADTLEQALRWGVELVAAFAEGMVEAASTVLIQAMNFIGEILSSWLLGASPPKIAPGIVKWGISLMDQYLRGMTEADFGILKQIQGPLKKILSGPEFAAVSKMLAGALAGGERGKFLETLGKAAGVFGEAVKKLAIANFELADSVTAVEEAEKALAKSREKVTDSQAEINKQTVEYNRLLRAGATDAELDAQLKLINAAEANLHTALDQVNVQEDALKTAKDRQSQLEDEAKLQQNIVDQLLGINDALSEQEKAKARAKKVKGLPPAMEAAIPTGFDISSRIGDAIDAAKLAIKEKFKDIFKPLREAWDKIKIDVMALGQVWDQFSDTVGNAWDRLKGKYPILQDVEDWTKNAIPLIQKNADGWTFFGERYGWAWSEVERKYPILQKVGDWFRDKFPEAIENVATNLVTGRMSLYNRWLMFLTFLKDDFWPWMKDTLWPGLVDFADTVVTPLETAIAGVAESFQWWYDKIVQLSSEAVTKALEQINKLLDFVTGHSPSPLELGLKGVNQQLQVLATTRLPSIANMGRQMQGAMAPMQQLSPISNTNVTMNMGGNNFYGGQDMAAFDARVTQSLRRTLRR